MKKILLASTILVGSAGVAAADVSFSGKAFLGIDSTDGGATWGPRATASMSVAMSGETDGGLMFGADFGITAGGYSSGATVAAGVGDATVWISGDFGKVSLAADTGASEVTLGYEGTFGNFGVEANYGMITPDWDVKLSYDFGDYDAYIKASYESSSTLSITEVGGSGTFGNFTVSASYEVDSASASGWDLGVDWTSGAISVGADFGVSRSSGNGTMGLSASYDLGGGASIDFAYDDADTATANDEEIQLGVSMKF